MCLLPSLASVRSRLYLLLLFSHPFSFFQCSGDHRALHSFPTRRSSDLRPMAMPATGAVNGTPASMRDMEAPHTVAMDRSEEHTSELQSLRHLVCRLLLEKKKTKLNAEVSGSLRHTYNLSTTVDVHSSMR